MANRTGSAGISLAGGITKRLEQLGMSRRELARRANLSRQTIHNIEKEGNTNLKPSTFRALDEALKWDAGTALALALGKGLDKETTEERVLEYVSRIALRLTHMTTEELELCLIMMEENELGQANHSSDEFTNRMKQLVASWGKQLDQLREQNHKHAS